MSPRPVPLFPLRAAALGILLASLAAGAAAARPAERTPLGSLAVKSHDARQDVFFDTVWIFRQGCDLSYRFNWTRQQAYPLRLRLHLTVDGSPAVVTTPWTEAGPAGAGVFEGTLPTAGCWVKRAGKLLRVTTETLGEPPRPAAAAGRTLLGKVVFNQWGGSSDVYYRHIQAWKEGCRIHFQFLYKRSNAARRRIRMKLELDTGPLLTPWVRSLEAGWREIAGDIDPPGCQAEKATRLQSAAFDSERY